MAVRSKGSRKPPDIFLHGTDAEVGNRDFESGLYSEYGNPQDSAPSFNQISPQAGAGSVNRAPLTRRSGEFKFSGGTGKP